MQNRKVILIGLDGATWDLIKPWINKQELPNFKILMENGCYGALESTIPHVTPPAWTSITTGRNPGKHGIFDFTSIEKADNNWKLNLYSSRSKKSKEIWDYIKGKSIIVNVPLTYPPRKINGIMVTGMYTPDTNSGFTYPEELKREILTLLPNYKIELDWNEYKDKKQNFIGDLYKMTDEKIKLFWHFFRTDWNFFFFVFVGPDRLQHIFWDEDELLKYYKYLDNFLGEIIKNIEKYNIYLFLISDHGFAKIKKIVYINSVLQDNGYLKLAMRKQSNRFFEKLGISKEKIMEILFKYKLIKFYIKFPSDILHLLRKTVPGKSNPVYDFDLKHSKAIMVGSGIIYILEENQSLKNENAKKIIEILENLENPNYGDKIIEKVFRKDEIYSGNMINKAPDLVILPKKGYSLSSVVTKAIIEDPRMKKADHALEGIFLAYGPGIKQGLNIRGGKLYDIVPTILHLMGIPVPKDMDGRVLVEIFKTNSEFSKREIKHEVNEEEKEILKSTIRNLKLSKKI